MPTDIKPSQAQLSKMIQSGGFLRNMSGSLGNIGKNVITDLAIPLAGDNVPGLVSNLASNANSNVIDKLGKKLMEKELPE